LRAAEGSPAATPASDTAELARLRRENDQLRMERAMLKKALGICSRMPQ
jgi:transposase-like protein